MPLHGIDQNKIVAPEIAGEELIKAQNEPIYNEGNYKVIEFLAGADLKG